MYKKSVRRRRLVLLLLVAASIALLTTQFRETADGALNALQRGIVEAVAPLQKGASQALKPARDLVNWFGDVFDAKSENERLKRQVEELQAEVAALSTAAKDNSELKQMVGLGDSAEYPQGYRAVTARVIARSPTVWYSTVTIDKGSDDGVKRDQPVVGGAGLVGRITVVASNSAQVTLITDHRSAVSAQIVPDGPTGIVKPAVGDPEDLILDFVERGQKVRAGAMLITAGWRSGSLGSFFPRGIPIGRITESGEGEAKLYQRAHLKPFAELRTTDVIQVLEKR